MLNTEWRGFRALNTPSTYTVVVVAVSGALIFYFSNLETVPVSGRTRFNVYSPESVKKAGEMEHKRLLWELEQKGVRLLPEWDPRTIRVKRVMARLIPFSGLQDENWYASLLSLLSSCSDSFHACQRHSYCSFVYWPDEYF